MKIKNKYLKLKAPLKVTFNITNRCNFKCIHCYNNSGENIGIKEELNLKEITKALEELKKIEVYLISINGGEPFLRKDILEILLITKKLGFTINLNTNGSLITKKIAQQIAKIGIKNIDISFQANNSKNFKIFTKCNKYNKVIAGIKNLIDVGVIPSLAFTITTKNAKWLPLTIKEASLLGINTIHTIVLVERGRAIKNKLTVNIQELKYIYSQAIESGKKYNVNLFLDCPFNLHENLVLNNLKNIKMDKGCFGGRYLMCIQSNGDITPCALFPEYIVGNIRKDKIIDIWNSSKMSVLSMKKYKLPDFCSDCKDLYSCYGGCPTSNFSSDKFMPDNFCPYLNN